MNFIVADQGYCQKLKFVPNIRIFELKSCLISIIMQNEGYLDFYPVKPKDFFMLLNRISGQKMLAALSDCRHIPENIDDHNQL